MLKLNLGCGPNVLPGWDNLDLDPGPGGIRCDLTKRLPYTDDSVDYIYSEHFIEHIPYDAALALLLECKRVLKPGGVIRFVTPDLSVMIQDYVHARLDRWASAGFVEDTPCRHLNGGMRYWGHTFVYDWSEFELLFKRAGFVSIHRMPWRVSNSDFLQNMETRPFFNDVILEAEKSAGQASPLVTVVMSSYNHEKFVGAAIDSVLNQTFQDFEFCITDDGSTDRTRNIIESYNDSRIKFVALEQNKGACYALNHAIRRGRGKYVAVINSDDCFVHDKLERQVQFLEVRQDIGAVFSTVDFVGEDGRPITSPDQAMGNFSQANRSREEWLAHLYYGGNCLAHPSAMIRMDCYLTVGHYDERFRQLPDYLMWLRVLRHWNIHVIPDALIKFRVLDDQKNESAPSPEVLRRCVWESIQISKEIMALSSGDFRYLAQLALPEITDQIISSQPREAIFAQIALSQKSLPLIEAALQLVYEMSPRNGSGGPFHELKTPSILATLVHHGGLSIG